ncbi:dihydrodipicolinate synthase family protein [Paenibacillus arenilitoris]|uniref:Dihydrodipicolinate synthase family protein n=1 Tax=Paenibacillus arenilitoris TaxID=2772299 RepID=A0A927H875_9BACL|nr:dihydrodipicolinate synthase family protein [Paenibacillus arenilitoris]MBD2871277.1 dihydrodipicolinate synthase family protein [Paenibacillus arenilitoris]
MLKGLSAFPLTPMSETAIDEVAFTKLFKRLVSAKVDSIGVLGSTGCYAYLSREERLRVTQLAVENAEGIPVMIGISALRTRDVLQLAEDAQRAGASSVLLAPVSYQQLTGAEVYSLYEMVTKSLSIPLCVYDNPSTTHFHFSDELHGNIARLPYVCSIKIPGVPQGLDIAKERVKQLRAHIPSDVTIGVSGDPYAAVGLNAGCETWYSVLGGLYPNVCAGLARAAIAGLSDEAESQSTRLKPLWEMFQRYGSLRVVATIAEMQGLIDEPSLPLPLQSLDETVRQELGSILIRLQNEFSLN